MYKCERKKIPAKVGMMSLVGVNKSSYPTRRGNYFDFVFGGLRCTNMWAENLQEARKRFLDDGLVEVDVYSEEMERYGNTFIMNWTIVVDERIPKDWLLDYPYFCGCPSMSLDMMKELMPKYNWNPDRMEEYFDPVSYWDKLGLIYKDLGNGICSISLKGPTKTRPLLSGWEMEVTQDIKAYHGEEAEEELTKILENESLK